MSGNVNRLVLFVDDDPHICSLLSSVLEKYGYNWDMCMNGEDAIVLTKAIMPDIMLVDYLMPGIDGLEVVKRLRERYNMQELPIIMMTAFDDGDIRVKSLMAGANDFVTKPVDPIELIMRINNILQLKEHGRIKAEREILEQTVRRVECAEKEWEHTLDCIDDIIMMVRSDNKIIRLNKALCQLIDKPYTNIIGRQWEGALEEHGFQKGMESMDEVEYCWQGKKWFSSRRYAMDDVPGDKGAYVVTLKDMTALKMAHMAVKESEAKFRQLSQSAPCAIFLYSEKSLSYVNPASEEITGYSEEELLSLHIWDIVHPDYREMVKKRGLLRLKGEKAVSRHELRILKKDGESRWVDASFSTIITEGSMVGLGVAFDVTEQKTAEQKIKDQINFLQTLLDAIPKPVFYKNADGVFLGCNAAFERFFGLTKEEVVGKSIYNIVPEQLADQYTEIDMALLNSQFPQQHEITVYDAHNAPRDVIFNNATFTDEKGTLAGLIGVIADITERKKMEKALQQSEVKYRGIYENAIEGIFQSLPDGGFFNINPALARMFGYETPEEMMGALKNVKAQYVDQQDLVRMNNLLRDNGFVKSFETRLYNKDMSVVWVSFNARAVQDENGRVIYYEGTLENISERKASEEDANRNQIMLEQKNRELQDAYNELQTAQAQILHQEKMASIGQLAAGIAHEINNPTGFIMSNLNSLKKYTERLSLFSRIQAEGLQGLSDGQKTVGEVLDRIEEARNSLKVDFIMDDLSQIVNESLDGAERIKGIVQDLKNFSRTDENKYVLSDINSGLESTINIVWNELKYKAVIHKDFGDIPETMCSLGQLNQVFMNLLINAAHAIDERGEIKIKTWESKGVISISISDTGCGMPEDSISKIFEPFYTTKEVGKGTGLGLSIAYDVVKKHKGDITVKSALGKGTEFVVTIPVVKEQVK